MTECDIISEEFPNAQLLICLYRTLRKFRREVCTAKMCISVMSEACCAGNSGQHHTFINKEDDNNISSDIIKILKQLNIATVTEYFEKIGIQLEGSGWKALKMKF